MAALGLYYPTYMRPSPFHRHSYEHFLTSMAHYLKRRDWLSWRSAWQEPGVCIGVTDFLPEALIRQFIFSPFVREPCLVVLFHSWSCPKKDIPGPLISCMEGEGVKTARERQNINCEVTRCVFFIVYLCKLRCKQRPSGKHGTIGYSNTRRDSVEGCSVLLQQTEARRASDKEKGLKLPSFLCFLLHSNLHLELRELTCRHCSSF